MATSASFYGYAMERLEPVGGMTARPMMGEYLLYYRGILVGGLYDNMLLLKPTPSGDRLLPDAERVLPYEGAKQPMILVEDLEDTERLADLLTAMAAELPPPKKKGCKKVI